MAKIHSDKKRRLYRPEIEVEYQSITQMPLVLLTIIKTGIRKIDIELTSGEYKLGVKKYLVIPKYKFIKK